MDTGSRPAAGADEGAAFAGRPVVVLGAGPRGPVSVDLADEGPHLLIEGPGGSGRTELLRAVAASLAAAARPDRLGILLVDGAGGERGESLRPCTELPHVFTHLVASDPVRMREFAQALGGELKRRAEVLGELDFAEWHSRSETTRRTAGQWPPGASEPRGDVDSQMSGTLQLRPAAARPPEPGPSPLPRLVVLVDDFDALIAPALGSPGGRPPVRSSGRWRPWPGRAAGSACTWSRRPPARTARRTPSWPAGPGFGSCSIRRSSLPRRTIRRRAAGGWAIRTGG